MKYLLTILFLINLTQASGQDYTQGKICYNITFSNEFLSQSKQDINKSNSKQKKISQLTKKRQLSSEVSPDAVLALFPKIQQEFVFFKKDTLVYWCAPVNGILDTVNTLVFRKKDKLEWFILSKGRSQEKAFFLKDKKAFLQPVKIKYKNDSRTIAGFKCKKAVLLYEDKTTNKKWEDIVFYTKEIANIYPFIENLKGCPLLIISSAGITKTATEVSFEPIPDEKFEIPKEYKVLTKD